jgi:hypothetical protein
MSEPNQGRGGELNLQPASRERPAAVSDGQAFAHHDSPQALDVFCCKLGQRHRPDYFGYVPFVVPVPLDCPWSNRAQRLGARDPAVEPLIPSAVAGVLESRSA